MLKKEMLAVVSSLSIGILLLASCQSGSTASADIATDSISIAQGSAIFNQNCGACHNFKQDGIGPSLSGITHRASAGWIRQFIRAPKDMIASGDRRAQQLFQQFHTVMPSFAAFKDEDLNYLMAFLHAQKTPAAKKEKDDPLAIKNPIPTPIPLSGLVVSLQPVTQLPATSDKEPLTRIAKMDMVPHTNQVFMLDQRGKLYRLDGNKSITYLDMAKWKPHFINQPGLATGFGSFAFHPDFATNGLLYTTHTEAPGSGKADFAYDDSIKVTLQWVLCEWKTNRPDAPAFSGTCRELLRINMVSGIHGVQEITFNPLAKKGDEDYGQLYIGVGDGGGVENGYPFLVQHPNHIWGSIIRIDPMGRNSANKQYGIPPHNPFSQSTDTDIVKELYAYGFRNPNRITWTQSGQMLATNIGQAHIESLNFILKGHDYGWPIREGTFALHPTGNINNVYPLPPNDSAYHITYPVAQYDHDEGNAIAGGFEYTGSALPALKGKYLFGDIPKGRLFYVDMADLKLGQQAPVKEWQVALNGKTISLPQLCGSDRVDLRLGRDATGEMYLFTKPDGKVYKFAAADQH